MHHAAPSPARPPLVALLHRSADWQRERPRLLRQPLPLTWDTLCRSKPMPIAAVASPAKVQGHELARVRCQPARAREPDGVVHPAQVLDRPHRSRAQARNPRAHIRPSGPSWLQPTRARPQKRPPARSDAPMWTIATHRASPSTVDTAVRRADRGRVESRCVGGADPAVHQLSRLIACIGECQGRALKGFINLKRLASRADSWFPYCRRKNGV